MRLTFHRPFQIGGCITEIESAAGTRIFIDLGHMLPEGDKPANDKFADKDAIRELTEGADAILYTHNHGDHVELFNLVPDEIPQYIGPLAARLMDLKYKRLSVLKEEHDACVDRIDKLKMFRHYEKGKEFKVGDIRITPFYVSHSATDSYMLKIRCDGKTVLHTGDFREHGYLGGGLRKVLASRYMPDPVDVLIIEGTNVGQPGKSVKSEQEVMNDFRMVLSKRKNVLVLCSSVDADRLESVYRANYATKPWRPLVCDGFQKQVMLAIASEYKGHGRFYQFAEGDLYEYYYDRDKNVGLVNKMKKTGFTMLIRESDKFAEWLKDILSFCKPEETTFVYSMYRGYVEPGWSGFRPKSREFVQPLIDHASPCLVPGSRYDYNHTSGHASMQSLREICEMISPRTAIVPIHHNPGADFRALELPAELTERIVEDSAVRDDITFTFRC